MILVPFRLVNNSITESEGEGNLDKIDRNVYFYENIFNLFLTLHEYNAF